MKHAKLKILFIVPSMSGGGAQKVVSLLLKHLNHEKFDIQIALLSKEGRFLNDIPPEVNLIDLDSKRVRHSIVKIIQIIHALKPDIVFSTMGHLNLLLSIIRPLLSKKISFIGRESNTVSIMNQQDKYPKLFDFLYRHFYQHFDHIVAQAEYMKNDLTAHYGISAGKITVINNPVDFNAIEQLSAQTTEALFDTAKINLLAVGRLAYQKGFDTLIEMMSTLDDSYMLTILGEGPDHVKLHQMIRDHSVETKVRLLGFQNNPYMYMKQADIFVLSSRFEGFPNVVLEANACGTPVIAFDCPGGTHEIIVDGQNGYLAKCQDKSDFVGKLSEITKGMRVDKQHLMKYEVSHIVAQYENLFEQCLKDKKR